MSDTFSAADAYRLVHQRVDDLLRGRTEVAERVVPACPAWTVRQTVSHLTGVCQDILAQNLQGAGSPAWTQAQVDRLAEHDLDQVLDLWAEAVGPIVDVLEQAPPLIGGQLVFDTLTHEHDVRGALGEPGARTDDPAFAVAAGFLTASFDRAIRDSGLPAMLVVAPTPGSVLLGDPSAPGSPVVVELSDFEMLRALGGRRSVAQLRALPWQDNPGRLLTVFNGSAVQPPEADLVE